MKINGKRTSEIREKDDAKKDARKSRRSEDKRSFKDLLRTPKDGVNAKGGATNESHLNRDDRAVLRERENPEFARDSDRPTSFKQDDSARDLASRAQSPSSLEPQKEAGEFRRRAAADGDKSGMSDPEPERGFDELSPEDERALMKGSVPGVSPATDTDVAAVRAPAAPTHARHEVTEKLLATIVSEGYVTEDVKGRKVVMMQVDIPGRGTVNMRLWRRSTGVELRMRADDPQLASEIRRNRARLESGARKRGVHFTAIEVVG